MLSENNEIAINLRRSVSVYFVKDRARRSRAGIDVSVVVFVPCSRNSPELIRGSEGWGTILECSERQLYDLSGARVSDRLTTLLLRMEQSASLLALAN